MNTKTPLTEHLVGPNGRTYGFRPNENGDVVAESLSKSALEKRPHSTPAAANAAGGDNPAKGNTMTIWGTYVFAKPLGRCVQTLRTLQPPENIPAMNNLLQTLDEYLQATDIKARDVFRKAIGRPTGGFLPLTDAGTSGHDLPAPLSDEEIGVIAKATCDEKLVSGNQAELIKFARAIEAQVRMESVAKDV